MVGTPQEAIPCPAHSTRPHHEVVSRAPHDHQLQFQLLGHQLHALAEGCDLKAIAGVGQGDDPVGWKQSAAVPLAPQQPA